MNKEDEDKIIMILFNRYNINPSAGKRMLDDIKPVIEQQLKDARVDELRGLTEFCDIRQTEAGGDCITIIDG